PEVFEIVDVERPKPLPTEILVRARAIGTNPVEAFIRAGRFPLARPPMILGWDVAGVVEEAAPSIGRFRAGDEVFGMPLFPRAASAYAEFVAGPSRHFARKPRSLSFEQAAALPL